MKQPAKKLQFAYIFSAYKLPENLVRLIKKLDDRESHFIICVDKRTDQSIYDAMRTGLKDHQNVHFLPRRNSVYRSFGHVNSSLRGLRFLEKNKIQYDYVSLMTGQDYPLKNRAFVQDFFTKNYGKSYIEHFSLPTKNWSEGGMPRIDNYFIHTRKKMYQIPRSKLPLKSQRALPAGITPWGGSGYWTLHKTHVDYILDFIRKNTWYVRFFKHADIADELFFQTILANSKFKNKLVNDDLVYVDWENPTEIPAVMRVKDLPKLKSATDIYARKFDETIDSEVLTRIDTEVLGG